jgi:nucleotide-binding universal stress UspA family protein
MFHHILVPLDGSMRAEQALPVAAQIARASGGSITLITVVTPPMDVVWQSVEPVPYLADAFEKEYAGSPPLRHFQVFQYSKRCSLASPHRRFSPKLKPGQLISLSSVATAGQASVAG